MFFVSLNLRTDNLASTLSRFDLVSKTYLNIGYFLQQKLFSVDEALSKTFHLIYKLFKMKIIGRRSSNFIVGSRQTREIEMIYLKGILLFCLGLFVASPIQAAIGKPVKCTKAISYQYMEHFDVSSYPIHDARIIGEALDFRNVKMHLMRITGRVDIDCKGCIKGRFTEEQKQRSRDYFIKYLSKLDGVEVSEKIYEMKTEKPRPRSKADDLTRPHPILNFNSVNFVRQLDSVPVLRPFVKWAEEKYKLDMEALADSIREASIEELQALYEKTKDIPVAEKPKEKSKKPSKKSKKGQTYTAPSYSVSEGVEKLIKNKKYQEQYDAIKQKEDAEYVPKYNVSPVGNVVAEIKGSKFPNEVIELTGHYDTTAPNKPGADDNGSAVALLMEMARVLSIHRPEKTVRLVINDLEERGMHGSHYHIKDYHREDSTDKMIGTIVVDTIAYTPTVTKPEDKVGFVLEVGTSSMQRNEKAYAQQLALTELYLHNYYKYTDRTASYPKPETYGALPGTTDLGNFWRAEKPAFLVAAIYEGKYINPGYHRETDVLELFNWGFYREISQVTMETVAVAAKVQRNRSALDVSKEDLSFYNNILDPNHSKGENRISNGRSETKNSYGDSHSASPKSSFDREDDYGWGWDTD